MRLRTSPGRRPRTGRLPKGKVLDPYSSAAWFHGWTEAAHAELRDIGEQDVVSAPTCWLLTKGWWRHGRISPCHVPKSDKKKSKAKR